MESVAICDPRLITKGVDGSNVFIDGIEYLSIIESLHKL